MTSLNNPRTPWLVKQGENGYAFSFLVKEQSGYPGYMLATASEIIDGQYADRPQLKLIFIAKINAAA
jgi:hypothetical protein